MIIFSFVIAILGTVRYFYIYYPFYLRFDRTFWCKAPYSVTLWMRTSGTRLTSYNSGKGILTIRFWNEEKAEIWDDKMFDSGEYKKYKEKK